MKALAWVVFVIMPFGAFAAVAIAAVGLWVCVKVLFWSFVFTCLLCSGPIMCELTRKDGRS